MKKEIKYIKASMKKNNSNNISIHTGKLEDSQIKELEKHFKVEKGFFGYTSFEKL